MCSAMVEVPGGPLGSPREPGGDPLGSWVSPGGLGGSLGLLGDSSGSRLKVCLCLHSKSFDILDKIQYIMCQYLHMLYDELSCVHYI